jgi:tetratricopeptide (TPR) repeat protein
MPKLRIMLILLIASAAFAGVDRQPEAQATSEQPSPSTLAAIKLGRAMMDFDEGNYDGALKGVDEAIRIYPTAEAWYYRGRIDGVKKNYESGIQDLSKAIELNPNFAVAFYWRGAMYVGKNDYDSALKNLDQSIRLDPNLAGAWYLRGVIKREKGDMAGAEVDIAKARQLDPNVVPVDSGAAIAPLLVDRSWDQDAKQCATASDLDHKVQFCSKAIESGKNSGKTLAGLLLLRGIAYSDIHDYDAGIRDFDRSISIDPRLEKTWHFRGRAYEAKHDTDRAIEDFSQAIVRAPNDIDALYDRGQAYLMKIVSGPETHTDVEGTKILSLGAGDYPRAIQDFSRILKLQPNHDKALRARAEAYKAAEDYDHAIEDWSQLIRLKPNDADAYSRRAEACQSKADHACVIRDLSKSLELDPNGNFVRYQLTDRGEAYLKTGDYDHAIQDFDRVVSAWPDDTRALTDRGEAHLRKGNLDRAIQDCTYAIKFYPKDGPAFRIRGDAYVLKGNYTSGMQDLNRAIQINPTYHNFNDRAYAYYRQGDFDRAMQDYDRAAHANPADAEALRGRGMMHARKGEYSLAIADLSQAIQLRPNEGASYFDRGIVHFYQGDFAAAQLDLARIRTYNYSALWLYLARARSGQEARKALSKDAAAMDLKVWPGPVIKHYLGDTTPESVLAAARGSDPTKQQEQLCEAYFYLGELALIAGEQDKARQFFRQTLDTQVTTFYEYAGAQQELKVLQAKR